MSNECFAVYKSFLHSPLAKLNTYFLFQDAWTAFHDRKDMVRKYLKALCIGEVETDQVCFANVSQP